MGIKQQVCHANHAIHWRSNLMTHIGKKFRFGLVRHLGFSFFQIQAELGRFHLLHGG